MSALGGMIHTDGRTVDPSLVLKMSRSMTARSRSPRCAYLNGGVGLFQNGAEDLPTYASPALPLTLCHEGSNTTLVLDGGLPSAEAVLEAYLRLGGEFVTSLTGAFSLAICDEGRGEVFLARDSRGARPLFYVIDGESLFFASEIKTLLGVVGDPICVSTDTLREHILSPCSTRLAEALYPSIHAFPTGHCGVFSRIGLTLFPYEEMLCATESSFSEAGAQVLTPAFFCPDRATLKRNLIESLFAFDYPQFDPWIPALLRALSALPREEKHRSLVIVDPMPHTDRHYAEERADRLCALFGASAEAIDSSESAPSLRELKKMDRLLHSLSNEIPPALITRLFGNEGFDPIIGERNCEKRIRMWGLLIQAEYWLRHYPIRLI